MGQSADSAAMHSQLSAEVDQVNVGPEGLQAVRNTLHSRLVWFDQRLVGPSYSIQVPPFAGQIVKPDAAKVVEQYVCVKPRAPRALRVEAVLQRKNVFELSEAA